MGLLLAIAVDTLIYAKVGVMNYPWEMPTRAIGRLHLTCRVLGSFSKKDLVRRIMEGVKSLGLLL